MIFTCLVFFWVNVFWSFVRFSCCFSVFPPFSCGVCIRPLVGLFEFLPHPGMRGVLLGSGACEFGLGAGEAGLKLLLRGTFCSPLMAELPHLTLWPVLSGRLGLGKGGFSAPLCSDWACSTRGRPASALLWRPAWLACDLESAVPRFLVSSLVSGGGGCYCPWQLAAGLLSFRVCGCCLVEGSFLFCVWFLFWGWLVRAGVFREVFALLCVLLSQPVRLFLKAQISLAYSLGVPYL